jgi:myo-inositol-1(or 4)-monophosphatase
LPSQRYDRALLDQLMQAATLAARRGAAYVRERTRDVATLDWQSKSRADFVSEVDLGAEERIGETLLERLPQALVLGEELTPEAEAHDGVTFIVDPLDGTTNFLHGFPEYAVSIGALIGGDLVAGVVLHVPQDTLFHAVAGGGAWRDAEPLRVSSIGQPARALIGTGFPFRHPDDVAPYLPQLARVMAETSGVRRAGAASLDLAHVASGHFDAFWELMLAPWDIAAGILLVREAGGRVTDLHGNDVHPGHTPVVASNGLLHDWLLERLRGEGSGR